MLTTTTTNHHRPVAASTRFDFDSVRSVRWLDAADFEIMRCTSTVDHSNCESLSFQSCILKTLALSRYSTPRHHHHHHQWPLTLCIHKSKQIKTTTDTYLHNYTRQVEARKKKPNRWYFLLFLFLLLLLSISGQKMGTILSIQSQI